MLYRSFVEEKMVKWLESRILWGALLIVAGVIFLLQNLFNFQLGGFLWGLVLGAAGVVFLAVFFGNRAHWWSLIPGFSLLGIAATILIDVFFPRLGNIFGGTLVLGGIALAFLTIYLFDHNHWWAIIPGGVMLTLSVFVLLEEVFRGFGGAGVFFLGLGFTFVAVALLPTPQGRMTWAWIPAGILLAIGVIVAAASEALLGYVGPIALILAGVYFILRGLIRR